MKLNHRKLRETRLRRVMTQQELADKAGTTAANISRLESGEQSARASTIRRLATALGVEAEELIDWDAELDEAGKAVA